MAFTKLNLKLGRGSYNSKNSISTLTTHTYRSDIDDFVIITTTNYFPSNLDQPANIVRVGDLMQIQDSTNEERIYLLTNLNPITLQIDSGNLKETVFVHATAWSGPYAAPIDANITFTKIGTTIDAHFEGTAGTATFAVEMQDTIPIPTEFRPSASLGFQFISLPVLDNNVAKLGVLQVFTNGNILIGADIGGGSFSGAGNTGFQSFYTTWISD